MLRKSVVKFVSVVAAAMMMVGSTNAFAWSACLSSSALTNTVVKEGGIVAFELKYTNDILSINLEAPDMKLCGFTGDVHIIPDGNKRIVVITNVHDTDGENRIRIAGGTAVSSDGRLANAITTQKFTIVK